MFRSDSGSLLCGILKKSHSILQKAGFFLAQNAPESFVAGLLPDPLGELTALPIHPRRSGPSRGEGREGKGRGDAKPPMENF